MADYQDHHAFRPRVRAPLTVGLVAGLVTIGVAIGAGETADRPAGGTTQVVEAATFVAASDEATFAQVSAQRSAESYLATGPLSRSSLITQLEFEEHSTADATWAVDQLGVDWDEQAARSAASYLETMPFSRDGLIDQLVSEGFTQEQAEYGAKRAGL